MNTNKNNQKQLIDFLIQRWRLMINFAAIERVFIASHKFTKANKLPPPEAPPFAIPHACRQIKIIKQHIIKIIPETEFIDYDYEAQAPLNPDDFVEMFVADHNQCIDKVEKVVSKMQIK